MSVYRASLCKSVRKYFESYIGYWERRAAEIEAAIPDDAEDRQLALQVAYNRLIDEMTAKKRLQGLPSLAKWARKIRVHPSTVSRWRVEHPEFDEACRDCDVLQNDILQDGGLSGVYHGGTVSFLLRMRAEREAREQYGGVEMTKLEDFDDD